MRPNPAGPVPLSVRRSVVVVSDWVEDGHGEDGTGVDAPPRYAEDRDDGLHSDVTVAGGYLERLPLALIAHGVVDHAEIWHHWRGTGEPPLRTDDPLLPRRAFRLDGDCAPPASAAMEAFVRDHGAPHILVVLGLGVAPALLELCAASVIIYNSIDAPALRVPPEVSVHFDLVVTGAPWQSDVVEDRHPGMATIVLPVGPEFAGYDQFRPLGTPKDFDLIYVAAAQPYKRHDILFDALAQLPRDVSALCVFGYGEMADDLRHQAAARGLNVAFVGPPGVPIDDVNRLMNRARFGVVCGVDDGAPAILTEYMLAGLPVLANAALSCGLQYVVPETGMTASAEDFAAAILTMRDAAASYDPRPVVLDRWTWPHSVAKLVAAITPILIQSKDAMRHGS